MDKSLGLALNMNVHEEIVDQSSEDGYIRRYQLGDISALFCSVGIEKTMRWFLNLVLSTIKWLRQTENHLLQNIGGPNKDAKNLRFGYWAEL